MDVRYDIGENQIEIKRPNGKIDTVMINQSGAYWAVKRFFDVFLSLLALIILFPVFIIAAIAIKIEDFGPSFFTQKRNGLDGKVFSMYKFRSMVTNAPELYEELKKNCEQNSPTFKLRKDPRITKVGRFIRKTSIDELPQLINIIKGDMSIVGPRPLPTYETEQCTEYQKQRFKVRPGLTCYWQVSGRSTISFNERMDMDLKYIRDASLWTDFKIILKTFVAVFTMMGAY